MLHSEEEKSESQSSESQTLIKQLERDEKKQKDLLRVQIIEVTKSQAKQ